MPALVGGGEGVSFMTKAAKVKACQAHYWVLGPPQGGRIHGICKKCGLERDFPDEKHLTRQEAAQIAIEFRKGVTGGG